MLRNLAMALFGAAFIAVGFSMTGVKVPTVHTWANWMPIVGFVTMVAGAVALLGSVLPTKPKQPQQNKPNQPQKSG
jgi:hypothetical protein